IYEAIGLINEQLWIGHFELWSSTGVLLYRHAALVNGGDEGTLSLAATELIVESAIDECERFYPVFQFVLWGGKSSKEALAAALIETQGEA
ncbi:MAG: YbjN domain-containing protein, partial [Sphingomonas sp.]